jgi:SIR2-like domain
MRFLADGPDIPIELLEDQRAGKVLFFCGAGISQKAGLPDFYGLTDSLLSRLGSQDAMIAFTEKQSLDRVFGELVREFGRDEVELEIFSTLKIGHKAFAGHHETILKLSCGPSGNPQIVTTNFDLLFEKAKPNVRKILPPALPDMGAGQRIDGVVYLHGRLKGRTPQPFAPFVISSADFGRAYLADGWATRFVKELRETYTIVLLGYSANDPPMRYLLEGLNARTGNVRQQPIYTFTHSIESIADSIWRDRGVRPICYQAKDKHHSGLWNSLAAWAEVVGNEAKWHAKLIGLSQRAPRELQPFERGQVSYFVQTLGGAKQFADSSTPPPAEWLLVFDSRIRISKSNSDENTSGAATDVGLYSIDSDDGPANECIDVLLPLGIELSASRNPQLYDWANSRATTLPERLYHLARWFTKISNSPTALWWMAGQAKIHPDVATMIDRSLRADQSLYHESARKLWNWMLEAQSLEADEFEWFDFIRVLKCEGWTGYAQRKFRSLLTPYVRVSRRDELPAFFTWSDAVELSPRALCELKVMVLERHSNDASIPAEALRQVVATVRNSLNTTADLLKETDTSWWRTHSLFPPMGNEYSHQGRKQAFFQWLATLMERLVDLDPNAAKAEVSTWNLKDPFFFGQLGVYVSQFDLAPNFYPVLSSLRRLIMPCWAGCAKARGA